MDRKDGVSLDPLNRVVPWQESEQIRVLDGPLPNLFCDEMKAVAKADFAFIILLGLEMILGPVLLMSDTFIK